MTCPLPRPSSFGGWHRLSKKLWGPDKESLILFFLGQAEQKTQHNLHCHPESASAHTARLAAQWVSAIPDYLPTRRQLNRLHESG